MYTDDSKVIVQVQYLFSVITLYAVISKRKNN